MKSIQNMSDAGLIQETDRRVAAERSATLAVLQCLREIESRQLFARLGFSSLFDICVKKFGYSESAALRRIDSMRLLVKVPELENKVEAGELKLSQLSQVQTFLKVERKEAGRNYSKEETLGLLTQVQGRSARDTDRILLAHSPAMQSKRETAESVKPVSDTHTAVTFVADAQTVALLEEARGLFAHGRDMTPSTASLVKRGLTALIAQRRKELSGQKAVSPVPEQTTETSPPTSEVRMPPLVVPRTRYIPAQVRYAVFQRAKGRCEFIASYGLRCSSRYALELHHRNPYAVGGVHSVANLAVFCRTHNLAQGREDFGAKGMRAG